LFEDKKGISWAHIRLCFALLWQCRHKLGKIAQCLFFSCCCLSCSEFNGKLKGSVKEPNILIYFFFSTYHSIVFCFQCSVYWWKGSVRF